MFQRSPCELCYPTQLPVLTPRDDCRTGAGCECYTLARGPIPARRAVRSSRFAGGTSHDRHTFEFFTKIARLRPPRRSRPSSDAYTCMPSSPANWFKPIRSLRPDAKWFVGGKLNVGTTASTSTSSRGGRQGRDPLGGRARRHPHDHLPRAARRGLPVRQRAQGPRRRAGDRVNIYLPMVPELAVAMLACARIGAAHSVVFGGFSSRVARRPHQRRRGQGADHRRRRLAARRGVPAQAAADEALADTPDDRTRRRRQARRQRRRHGRRSRPLVPRADGRRLHRLPAASRWTPSSCCSCSTPRAPPASPRASCTPRRATSPTSPTPQVRLRPASRRRRLLVHRRRRLDHRATATSSTAALERRHQVMYEGAPNHPGNDRFWEIVEKYGVTIFYTAPTAIRTFMKWGATTRREARPVVAAPARHGRRADQPRGVDVVPRTHRRRALPDRRHLVADRDRRRS
jgi:hypothetical protein